MDMERVELSTLRCKRSSIPFTYTPINFWREKVDSNHRHIVLETSILAAILFSHFYLMITKRHLEHIKKGCLPVAPIKNLPFPCVQIFSLPNKIFLTNCTLSINHHNLENAKICDCFSVNGSVAIACKTISFPPS